MPAVAAPAPVVAVAPVAQYAQPAALAQSEQSVVPAAPVQPAQVMQAPIPEPEQELQSMAVFIHLSSGERIWAGRFDSAELAENRASEIVRALNRPEPGVWAKFGNRLIRPEAVVSIELSKRLDH